MKRTKYDIESKNFNDSDSFAKVLSMFRDTKTTLKVTCCNEELLNRAFEILTRKPFLSINVDKKVIRDYGYKLYIITYKKEIK